jgi:hypothetical protein
VTYDEEPDDLFSDGPSKAQVDATVRAETTRQQRQRNDVLIARWRQQHKDATCSDAVALELARWQFCWFKDRETP